MVLEFTPTAGDYKAFQRFWSQRNAPRVGWLNGIVLLVILVAFGFYFRHVLFSAAVVNYLIVPLGFVAGLLVLGHVVHNRQLANSLPGPMTVSFAEDGVHHADTDSRVVTRWGAVQQIARTKDHLFLVYGQAKSVIIPTHAFDSAEALEKVLAELRLFRPDLEIETADAPRKKGGKTKLGSKIAGGIFLALLCFWFLSPWRDSLELPGELGSMSYVTVVTGDADSEAALPLIIELHPLGGFPEIGYLSRRNRDFQARVVLPTGPDWWVIGYSWFSLGDDMAADARREAERLAAFTESVMEIHPTLGRPIVTGFSQGGSMSFQLAAFYPDLYAAAVPVAGALPDHMPEREAAPDIKVRAFHGAEDETVPMAWAAHAVEHMREQGWDVDLKAFPDRGHAIGRDGREQWNALLGELVREQGAAR